MFASLELMSDQSQPTATPPRFVSLPERAKDEWGHVYLGIGRVERTPNGNLAMDIAEVGEPTEVMQTGWKDDSTGQQWRRVGRVIVPAEQVEELLQAIQHQD